MMTLRENAMAIYYGEKPDFYGDLMDAVELIPDPVLMGDLPPQDGLEHKDSWGTVYVFKPGAPGPHPPHPSGGQPGTAPAAPPPSHHH